MRDVDQLEVGTVGLWGLLFRVPLPPFDKATLVGCCLVSYVLICIHCTFPSLVLYIKEASAIASCGTVLSSGTGFL